MATVIHRTALGYEYVEAPTEFLATAYAKAVLSCDNLSEWQDNNLANNLTCVPVSL